MDFHALDLFLKLAENLHFAKTGQACNISPSALSRQIQRVEHEVGQVLFERDNRMVKLTQAGYIFKAYAKETLEKWQDLLDTLADENKILKGELSLYCSVTASLSILPDLLARFRTRYPDIKIRLQTGDASVAIKKVAKGEIDLAVAALPDKMPKSMSFRILTRMSLAFIAPKKPWEFSTAIEKKIEWEKIPIILSQQGLARQRINQWFAKQKITPKIYAQVAGNEAILSMVSLGCGIGVVPTLVIDLSPVKERITRLDIKPEPIAYDVGICVQKRKMKNRLVQAFLNMVS